MTTNIAQPASLQTLEDIADDLIGLDLDLNNVVRALLRIAARPLDADLTASLMVGLAGGGPSVIELIAVLVSRLGCPSTNSALRSLPDSAAKQIGELTNELVSALTDWLPASNADEAAALIHEA